LEEALVQVLEVYIEKQDPVRKASRVLQKKPTLEVGAVTGQVKTIPAVSRHETHLRDQGQCAYRNPATGERCSEAKWIELHHIRPKSRGGSHASANLSTLCSGHHRMLHFLGKFR
jgi:hypothetical protein